MAIVQASGLTRVYGSGDTSVTALDDVDLAVEPGESIAIPSFLALLITSRVIGVVFGVLAALVPAQQAAKFDIVRALHYE